MKKDALKEFTQKIFVDMAGDLSRDRSIKCIK